MAIYTGFSTQDINVPQTVIKSTGTGGGTGTITNPVTVGRKYRLVDEQLVVRDLLNALSINQGDKVGNPSYGSTLRTYLFQPNTTDVQSAIEDEVRRVVSLDARIILNTLASFPQENGILIELEMAVNPKNQAFQVQLYADATSGQVTQL